MSELDDATKRAFEASYIAKTLDRKIKSPDKPRPSQRMLHEVREADTGGTTSQQTSDLILEAKVKCITLLHNVGHYSLAQCDKILHLNNGTSATLATRHPEMFQLALRESIDSVLKEFYRNNISVLENLMAAAPNTVKMLKQIQEDESRPEELRLKAGDKIFDWTKMILTTKAPDKVKKVLGDDLKEHAEEADAAFGMLESSLMGVLDGTDG